MFPIESRKRRRPTGFALSALVHAGILSAIVFTPPSAPSAARPRSEHKYSVLVLHLDAYRPKLTYQHKETEAGAGQSGARARTESTSVSAAATQGASAQTLSDTEPAPSPTRHQPFVLPPVPHQQLARQTLIQPDVPPDVQLKHEIPLATALIWEHLPPLRKKYVAPTLPRKQARAVEMAETAELATPNHEALIANLKLAAMEAANRARLVRPPAKTAPLRGTAIQPANEAPQIALSPSPDASLAALISLPDAPVTSAQTLAVPPANQVAAAGSGGTGTSGGSRAARAGTSYMATGTGSGSGPNSAPGSISTASSAGVGNRGTEGDPAGLLAARGGGSGLSGAGVAGSGAGGSGAGATHTGSADSRGAGTELAGSAPDVGGTDLQIPGTTRLLLPKDGKYGVVVTGSSLAAPYAESIGALSGKAIYSVYISVGLRKKWILQYCLSRADEQKSPIKGAVQKIDAPWPYQIVRPDQLLNTSGEYVIVRGILTPDGRFAQLGLVFPAELDRRELLMSSLKQWTFRPASRDGVPAEVEVLLIIPGTSE